MAVTGFLYFKNLISLKFNKTIIMYSNEIRIASFKKQGARCEVYAPIKL